MLPLKCVDCKFIYMCYTIQLSERGINRNTYLPGIYVNKVRYIYVREKVPRLCDKLTVIVRRGLNYRASSIFGLLSGVISCSVLQPLFEIPGH